MGAPLPATATLIPIPAGLVCREQARFGAGVEGQALVHPSPQSTQAEELSQPPLFTQFLGQFPECPPLFPAAQVCAHKGP